MLSKLGVFTTRLCMLLKITKYSFLKYGVFNAHYFFILINLTQIDKNKNLIFDHFIYIIKGCLL